MTRSAVRTSKSISFRRLAPSLIVVAFGMLILFVGAAEEPYNIDELRQTRHYDKSFQRVIDESFLVGQPPLDALVNAQAQRVLGVGDIQQRLLSIIFGTGSLVVMAVLCLRSGLAPMGSAVVVAVMALTPVLINVTAYARPYALPLFLMLSYLLLVDYWLAGARWLCFVTLSCVAVLLPLSKTVEPMIFLVLIIGAMGLNAFRDPVLRFRSSLGTVPALLGLMTGALLQARLSSELSDYTKGHEYPLIDRLMRLVTDLPHALTEELPYWPLLLIAIGLLLMNRERRTRLFQLWWWWVLTGTAVGFAVALFVTVPTSQPFYGRYVFSWVPSVAVLAGSLIPDSSSASGRRDRIFRVFSLSVAVGILAWAFFGSFQTLTTRQGGDWRAASEVIVDDLPKGTAVVFDPVRPLGSYRTPFAGNPRYTGTAPVRMTLQIIHDPSLVAAGDNTAILLHGSKVVVPGWVPISVDDFFTVYVPETPRPGLEGIASSAEEFGTAIGPISGAALKLTAAAIWQRAGDVERASDLLSTMLDSSRLRPVVLDAIRGSDLETLLPTGVDDHEG